MRFVALPAGQPVLRLVRVTVIAAVVATVLQSLATATNLFVLDGSVEKIDATIEGGVWTWAAAGSTLVAAVAAAAIAVAVEPPQPAARRFWLLAGALAFFSLDDWLVLHERVGEWVQDELGAPSYVGGLWVLVYPPLLAIVVWGFWRTALEATRPLRRLLLASLGLLAAAVVIELIGVGTKAIEESTGNAAPHDVRAILEEGAELAAWILAAGGLIAVLVGAMARRGRSEVAIEEGST